MTDQPTRAVEQTLQAVHAALAARFPGATLHRVPIYQHWEDEELGYPPLYEQLSLHVEPAGIPAWCSSDREGRGLEGILHTGGDHRDPRGPHALVFDAADRARLRAHGWRGPSGGWRARWPAGDPARVLAAYAALADTAPRVLLPEDLPPGAPWPWFELLFSGLLAEVVRTEGAGPQQIVVTRLDGEPHRFQIPAGSEWDRLWQQWRAAPPAMRPYAQWHRR